MIVVEVQNGNVEKALMVFRKKVENTRLLEEYKERQYFTKPSLARRQRRLANAKYKRTITD